MWRLMKRWLSKPPPVEPDGEVILRIDESGFMRSSHLIRTMGWREHWGWDEIVGFGFAFSPAMFPDPWFGDCMESQWFFTVKSAKGEEHVYFDAEWIDVNRLPPALVRNMPGLNTNELRRGLAAAAVGFHNFEGEGRWIGWQRSVAGKRAGRSKSRSKKLPTTRNKSTTR